MVSGFLNGIWKKTCLKKCTVVYGVETCSLPASRFCYAGIGFCVVWCLTEYLGKMPVKIKPADYPREPGPARPRHENLIRTGLDPARIWNPCWMITGCYAFWIYDVNLCVCHVDVNIMGNRKSSPVPGMTTRFSFLFTSAVWNCLDFIVIVSVFCK